MSMRSVNPTTEFAVRAAGMTDAGLVRETNQDAFLIADLSSGRKWSGRGQPSWSTSPKGVLLAVSDGMGGANAGEIASALAIEGLFSSMLRAAKTRAPDGETLRRATERASRRIHEEGHSPERRGMGATLTAVLIRGPVAYVAQVGDSRAYLWKEGSLLQCTHDQSYVQMLVDAGVLTPQEAERSPRKNIVLQAMGQEQVQVDVGRLQLGRGVRLLLCSDGLTNVVGDEVLRRTMDRRQDPVTACEELVRLTKSGGAPDNVTVVIADVF